MNETKSRGTENKKLLVDTIGLQEMLSSGRQTAVSIGAEAGAKCCVGRRAFWHVEKVRRYINAISE